MMSLSTQFQLSSPYSQDRWLSFYSTVMYTAAAAIGQGVRHISIIIIIITITYIIMSGIADTISFFCHSRGLLVVELGR